MEPSNDNSPTRVILEPSPGTELIASGESLTSDDGAALFQRIPVKPQERYRFIRSIGFGGMKAVLLVHDSDTARDVAMAIMPDFRDRPIDDRVRFVREALRTARLEHPNIVPVHDIGLDHNGSPFFTMKYLRGESLSTLLRKLRRRDPAAIAQYSQKALLQILIRICNAIAFAHSQGVLHLDLKPGNIHVGQHGEVSVIDWGLARELIVENPRENDEKNQGVTRGTPGYMAPEQAAGYDELQDERTDIYALGAILYAMLTCMDPLTDLPTAERLRRTVSGEIPAPSELVPGVPFPLEAICRQAMAVSPADRYANVVDFRTDIFAFLTGYAPKAERAPFWKQLFLFLLRHRIWVLVGLVVALLLTGVYLYWKDYLTFSVE